ncbi:MAG: TIGR04282 family arsenosugar biosynthesis glycosyltransferase [Planctomycetes bacterium]|nr:TIGR04282 family arsenosugar biosynthesis glycosyltransferase [Planctomycetota bacterium]MBL7037700.1 TIGR04282 family arsenosugar biosynthesis glycosyltransferase [Pirellulaceae bacterium]
MKTRLGTGIGHDLASELYRVFLLTICRRFEAVGDRRILAYTPDDRHVDFEELAGPCWELERQSTGDLGCRMQDYFGAAFQKDADAVVLIGSDAPTLPLEFVQRAFDLLAEYRVVLGPSSDGGYYLVGASGGVPPIFSGISWSSPHVWSQTTELLDKAGLLFGTLPTSYDVDDQSTLNRLYKELKETHRSSPLLADLWDAVRRVLPERDRTATK